MQEVTGQGQHLVREGLYWSVAQRNIETSQKVADFLLCKLVEKCTCLESPTMAHKPRKNWAATSKVTSSVGGRVWCAGLLAQGIALHPGSRLSDGHHRDTQ